MKEAGGTIADAAGCVDANGEWRRDRRSSQSHVGGGIHSEFFSFIQRCSAVSVRRAIQDDALLTPERVWNF